MLVLPRKIALLATVSWLCASPLAATAQGAEQAGDLAPGPSPRQRINEAVQLGNQERYEEAGSMLADLAEQFAGSGDTVMQREALVELGLMLGRQGRVDEGADRLRQALPLADASVDRSAPIAVRLWLARIYIENGRAIDALPWADAALLAALAANRGDFLAAPSEMYLRSTAAIDDGDSTLLSAIDHVDGRLQGVDGYEGREQLSMLVFTRGVEFLDRGEGPRALASMQLAVRLADLLGEADNTVAYLTGIGYVAFDLDDLTTSRGALERGLGLPDGRTVAMLSTQALVAWREGWLEEASALLREAADLAQQQGEDAAVQGKLAGYLAELACAMADTEACRRELDLAVELSEQGHDDGGVVANRALLALLSVHERRWEEAEGDALGSLSLNRNPMQNAGGSVSYLVPEAAADALLALAAVHHQRDELDEARRELSQATAILARESDVDAWVGQACAAGHLALATGDTEGAMEVFDAVIGTESPGPMDWRASHGAGLAHWRLGDLAAAEESLRQSLEALAATPPQQRQPAALPRPFGATVTQPRDDLVFLLLEQERIDEAFAAAGGQAPHGPGAIEAGTALLRYTVTKEQALGWLVTPDGLEVIRIPAPAEELAQLADELRLGTGETPGRSRRRAGPGIETLQQLYGMLFASVAPVVEGHGIETLLIQAEGPIGRLPLEALHDGERFLVERYALVWLPASSAPAAAGRPTKIKRAAVQGMEPGPGACDGVTRRFRNAATLAPAQPPVDIDLLCVDGELELNHGDPVASRPSSPRGTTEASPGGTPATPAVVVLEMLAPPDPGDAGVLAGPTTLALEGLVTPLLDRGASAVLVPQLATDDETSAAWMEAYCRALNRGPRQAIRHIQLQMIRAGEAPGLWASWRAYGR